MAKPETETEIEITRGSDLDFDLLFEDEDELGVVSPTDLTGASAALYEAHPDLVGSLVPSIDDTPTSGLVHMALTWSDANPFPPGREMSFYLRLTFPGGRRRSSAKVRFWVR